jgi:hypothetical protein
MSQPDISRDIDFIRTRLVILQKEKTILLTVIIIVIIIIVIMHNRTFQMV